MQSQISNWRKEISILVEKGTGFDKENSTGKKGRFKKL